MTKIQRALAAAAASLLLIPVAACTSSAPEPEASEDQNVEEQVVEESLPAVSLQTTCQLLFGSNVDGPVADAQDIVTRFAANPDLSTVTTEELELTVTSLAAASKNADPAIKPYIDATSKPLQQMLDALTGGVNSDIEFTDYKASGLELITQCTPYL